METLAVNAIGQLRVEYSRGREFLVAPMTMIVPGVLPGSQGPLYYPPEECVATANDWHHIPITVNHPSDPVTNSPLSAKDAGVIERQGIGFVRHPEFGSKLRAEAWIDVQKANSVDKRVVANLRASRKMEISTGLYTTNMPALRGSHHNGRPYSHVATRHRPDHLAILPDNKGACSLEDGCGLLVNTIRNANPEGVNQYSKGGGAKPNASKQLNPAPHVTEDKMREAIHSLHKEGNIRGDIPLNSLHAKLQESHPKLTLTQTMESAVHHHEKGGLRLGGLSSQSDAKVPEAVLERKGGIYHPAGQDKLGKPVRRSPDHVLYHYMRDPNEPVHTVNSGGGKKGCGT